VDAQLSRSGSFARSFSQQVVQHMELRIRKLADGHSDWTQSNNTFVGKRERFETGRPERSEGGRCGLTQRKQSTITQVTALVWHQHTAF